MAVLAASGSFFLKAIALLVFLGGIAAATYGVQTVVHPGSATAALGLRIDALHPLVNATGGHQVTFDIVVTNHGDIARTLNASVEGAGVSGSAPAQVVPVGTPVTFFVTVTLPADVTGTHDLRATIATPDGSITRSRDDVVKLRILPTAPGYENGRSQASALYVGRFADTGKVFNTNDPALIGTSFPRAEGYQPSNGEIQVAEEAGLVDGFVEGVTGMQAGEWRTFTFGPEKGFGNATSTRELERVESFDRDFPIRVARPPAERASFDQFINQSHQGDPRTFGAGDVFHAPQGANNWSYRIVSINETAVLYKLDAKVGENYTIFPFWPNASRVVSVNETTVLTRTTPTTGPGEKFSYYAYWPGFSELVATNETSIQVRHSPPVGFKFTLPQTQFEPATDATVHELTDSAVVISVPSNNPLAGRSLTFDVYFSSLTK